MPQNATSMVALERPTTQDDDTQTMVAISVIAAIVCNSLHEGVGHGLLALLTGARSGVLTTVAWSSAVDSRLIAAGGTLVNLAAALVFWLALRFVNSPSVSVRYFLLISCAFNLFTGTGYFFFSGVTNFGDWAVVIAGMHPHWLWRVLLIVGGVASYFVALVAIGIGFVRYVGIGRNQQARLRRLTVVPYLSAVVLASIAAPLNPLGIQLLWQSALPATAGGHSGLLWLQYYIPRGTEPQRRPAALGRSHIWIFVAAALALVYVLVLGRGITIHL